MSISYFKLVQTLSNNNNSNNNNNNNSNSSSSSNNNNNNNNNNVSIVLEMYWELFLKNQRQNMKICL